MVTHSNICLERTPVTGPCLGILGWLFDAIAGRMYLDHASVALQQYTPTFFV